MDDEQRRACVGRVRAVECERRLGVKEVDGVIRGFYGELHVQVGGR